MVAAASFTYRALGVSFRSESDLPGLARAAEMTGREYRISESGELGDLHDAALKHYLSETVAIAEAGDRISIRYADGTRFEIDPSSREIRFSWNRSALTLEDVCTYLTGPVIGLVAGLEGFACFHGAAAVVDGGAVMVVAPSEGGKSTTAAAFALDGFAVLSDDVCATTVEGGSVIVAPAFPRVRLWGPSVEMLFGAPDALPLLTPNWDKRYLDLEALGKFAPRPAALALVVVLDAAQAPRSFGLDKVDGAEAAVTLLGNSYPQSFTLRKIEPRIFGTASFIARHVPVVRIPAYLPPRETLRRILAIVRS